MFYDYHTTKMAEREKLLEGNRPFKWVEVKPTDILKVDDDKDRGKSIIWDQDYDSFYENVFNSMTETLRQYDENPQIRPVDTFYFQKWRKLKGDADMAMRTQQFFELYESIKAKGFDPEAGNFAGGICVEQTGERLDGSHRTAILIHLGIEKVKVKQFAFNWQDIDEDFICRKLKARELGIGPNYYFIDYGNFTNLPASVHPTYKENAAPRWELLENLIKPQGKVILDLGCNEGYLSIMAAKTAKRVIGYDYSYIDGANTNKLIFEYLAQRDLPVEFVEADISDVVFPVCDTALLLNAIYHLPRPKQIPMLFRLHQKCKHLVVQCNLRKAHVREEYFGSHPEDMKKLLEAAGWKVKEEIQWLDKPVIIAV
ncbi:MAG: methyltransferase domain-containing protein [Patescibacteria group bacterium]|nr:methyltransferase domain-containing protein [Patescibacteria group bacterium]